MPDRHFNDEAAVVITRGTRLNGIFEIDQRLAAGGMGEIYRGHALETGDLVAIKVLRADLADDGMALALFRNEAKVLHSIQHEAIVRYYIFSSDPGIRRHYLAMEFVEGEPLSDVLRRGPLTFDQVTLLQRRLAAALHEAHGYGIVHRDISPDNILLPDGDVGRAKIIDFGIARSTRSTTIIGIGFAGKHNYVSPEQVGLFEGDATAKSDVYSLGIVLAECMLGRPLGMGGSHVEMIEKRSVVPDLSAVDPRLRPLLIHMLQPDPKYRLDSMAAVAAWQPSPQAAGESSAAYASRGQDRHMAARQKNARLNWKSAAGKLAALALPLLLGSSTPVMPQPPIKNPIERILRFVNTYDGGDCFFVAPVTVTEQEARLEGYGSSRDPFDVLDSGFRREIGFEAMIGVGPVTSFQCAAVAFLSRMRKQPGSVPQIEIDDANLNTEGALTGSVTDFVNRHVDLILIAGDGTFSNLSGELRSSGGFQKSFNIQMSRTHYGPQLLLAIGSNTPLTALRSTGIADRAFARATAEAAETR